MPSSSNKNLSSHSHDDESTGFDYYNRRLAVEHVFKTIYQQAEPELWHEKQVVSGIKDRLGIPSGSRNSVKKVLLDILEAKKHKEKYNAKSGVLRRGRKKLITEGSEEEAIILRCAAADLLSSQIAVAVNHHSASKNSAQAAISWSTVASYLTNSDLIVRQLRRTRKTGGFNPGSGWAQARKAQCEQFLIQLSLGKIPPDELQ